MGLLEELEKVRRNLYTLENIINQQAAEIERLRSALQRIKDNGEQGGYAYGVAFAALTAVGEYFEARTVEPTRWDAALVALERNHTIERCAQVAKEIGHKMSNDDRAIAEIVAGILALKEEIP